MYCCCLCCFGQGLISIGSSHATQKSGKDGASSFKKQSQPSNHMEVDQKDPVIATEISFRSPCTQSPTTLSLYRPLGCCNMQTMCTRWCTMDEASTAPSTWLVKVGTRKHGVDFRCPGLSSVLHAYSFTRPSLLPPSLHLPHPSSFSLSPRPAGASFPRLPVATFPSSPNASYSKDKCLIQWSCLSQQSPQQSNIWARTPRSGLWVSLSTAATCTAGRPHLTTTSLPRSKHAASHPKTYSARFSSILSKQLPRKSCWPRRLVWQG